MVGLRLGVLFLSVVLLCGCPPGGDGGGDAAEGEIRGLVQEFLSQKNDGTVILVPDEALPSGRLVAVMDTVKGAGAMEVAIATANPETGR